MTQELYQKAIKFAGEKHSNQKVPGTNSNYLLHISNVVMEILMAFNVKNNFDIDFAIQVAILHDTIEDTNTSFKELEDMFSKQVAIAVLALSKDETLQSKKEMMVDSLKRINLLKNEVGMVKLADRITNLQEPPSFWDINKVSNYLAEAKQISESLSNKNEYLNNRLKTKIKEYEKFIKTS